MSTYELDVPKLYAALDLIRHHDGMSWRDVARGTGCSPSTFTRLAAGNRPDADALCTLMMWLNMPLRGFIRPATAPKESAE